MTSASISRQSPLLAQWGAALRRLAAALAWRDDAARDRGACPRAWVALVSGLCGIVLGVQTGLQIPVESAQVLAGLVEYPADNPFFMYHIKSWTLLHQGSAALLAVGLSERAVSVLLGGLLGMVVCQALTLCTLALCRNGLVAVLVPILCLGTRFFDEMQGVYDIFLLSDRPWKYYGAFATAMVLLIWALYALELRRTAACLMGLAPAFHPTLGGWCLAIGGLSLLWTWRRERPFLKSVSVYLLLGLALSTASFAYHLHQTRGLPEVAPEVREQFVTSFAMGWDRHRQPVPLDEPILGYGLAVAAISSLWLVFLAREAAAPIVFLMRAILISAALGLLLALSTHLRDHLPTLVTMAMPGRYVNVVGLAFPAVLLGMLGRYRVHLAFHALLAGVILYLVLWQFRSDVPVYVPELRHSFWMAVVAICAGLRLMAPGTGRLAKVATCLSWAATAVLVGLAISWLPRDRYVAAAYLLPAALIHLPSLVRRVLDHDTVRWLAPAVIAVGGVVSAIDVIGWQLTTGICVGALAAAVLTRSVSEERAPLAVARRRSPSLTRRVSVCAGSALGGVAGSLIAVALCQGVQTGYDFGLDWRNDLLLAHVRAGQGYVLTGPGVRSMQLRTRRPVLLEVSALNQLPYVPESGPAMNHILRRIYDEDILRPRPSWWVIERGGLMRQSARDVWEARTPGQWDELAQEFGFTQIVVRADWQLQLPIVAQSSLRTLYDVTAGGSSGHAVVPQIGPGGPRRAELPAIPASHRPHWADRSQDFEDPDP
jgi:hypothetical protein